MVFKRRSKFHALLLGIPIFYTLILSILNQVTILNSLKFILFQILIIFIPGYLIATLFLERIKDRLFFYVFAYASGVIMNQLLYFTLNSLNILRFATLFMWLIGILSTVGLYFRKKNILEKESFDETSEIHQFFLIILLIMGLYVLLFNFTLPYLLIGDKSYYSYYLDSLWHIGNIISAKNGFPIQDLRVDGVSMHYHFFMHIYTAMLDMFIGSKSVASTFFSFSQIGPVILMLYSFYVLARRSLKSSALSFVTTLFIFIINRQFVFAHIFQYPTGVSFALAYEFISIYYVLSVLLPAMNGPFKKYIILNVPLHFLIFGALYSKAPMGVLTVCTIVSVLVYHVIKTKKNITFVVFTSILLVGASYLLYKHFFVSESAGSSSLGLVIDFGKKIIHDSTMYKYFLNNYGEPNFIQYFIIKIYGFFEWLLNLEILPWVMPVFILGIFRSLLHPLKIGYDVLIYTCFILGGLILTFSVRQDGQSEYYFFMALAPILILQSVLTLISFFSGIQQEKLNSKLAILLVVISLSTLLTSFQMFSESVLDSLKNYSENTGIIKNDSPQNPADSISKAEFEGLNWLKDNTNKEDLIMSDRSFFEQNINFDYNANTIRQNNFRYFYYSAFSERKNYLEGFAYQRDSYSGLIKKRNRVVDELFNGSKEKALHELKTSNVRYIIITKRLHPNFKLDLKKVFHNEEVSIYQLQ